MKDHNEVFISRVENIRKENNTLWMDILRIAMCSAPNETKEVLRKINHNDNRISILLKTMAE